MTMNIHGAIVFPMTVFSYIRRERRVVRLLSWCVYNLCIDSCRHVLTAMHSSNYNNQQLLVSCLTRPTFTCSFCKWTVQWKYHHTVQSVE